MPQARLKPEYKSAGLPDRHVRRRHYLLGTGIAFLLGIFLLSVSSNPTAMEQPDLADFVGGMVRTLEVPPLQGVVTKTAQVLNANTVKLTVRSGDTLAKLFDSNALSLADLHTIMQLGEGAAQLRELHPGDVITVHADEDGGVLRLMANFDGAQRLEVFRENGEFLVVETLLPVQRTVRVASGVIHTSLYQAGYDAGLSDALIMNLAGIFGWDIDFALDIREGDQFRVIYEEVWRDGEKLSDGPILAAEFINDGRQLEAVRFEDEAGNVAYYSPDGKAMRKTFLRAPLNFSYVSSGFNPRRFHPVLKRVKAHNGIDYRAPKGTPVYAAGDGRVIRSAYDKYNGHHVFIQHGQRYVTKYLHFTRRTVKVGERVKQGEVIGYVGSTGLATGAHLHYEFLVNGVHRNPRTVKLPDAEPIAEQYRERFAEISAPLLRQFELIDSANTRIAAAP